jgi:hypothetical protein
MAIDAGGSTLRLSAQTANGQLVDHQTHPSGRQQLGYPFVEKSAPLLAAFAKERNVTLAVGTDAHGLHYAWDAAGLGDIPLVTLSEVILATSPISASDVVLIAGTGSTCATVVYGHRSQVTGALGCDKDPGCGVSIGRATRAAITAARSKQGPQTALVDAISLTESQLAALDLPALASLATTTSQVGYAGDPVAASICTRAASELMKLLGPHDVVYYARSGIITQGSVIGPGSLVGDLVRQSLASLTKRMGGIGVKDTAMAWLLVFSSEPLIFGAAALALLVALVAGSTLVVIACVLAFIGLTLYGSYKSGHWPDELDN